MPTVVEEEEALSVLLSFVRYALVEFESITTFKEGGSEEDEEERGMMRKEQQKEGALRGKER